MTTFLDIIGSVVIGGIFITILLNLNDSAVENAYVYGNELTLQENLVSIATLLEYDFRKMGQCADPNNQPDVPILAASDTAITFVGDLPDALNPFGDGVPDTIAYYLGPAGEMSANPRIRILYRTVNNGAPVGSNMGVTQFRLQYFDGTGTVLPPPVASPAQIYTVQIDLKVENVYGVRTFTGNGAPDSTTDASSAIWREMRFTAHEGH